MADVVEEQNGEVATDRLSATSRIQECRERVQAVLDEFDCTILPRLTHEPVGYVAGAKLLIGATYHVVSNTEEP